VVQCGADTYSAGVREVSISDLIHNPNLVCSSVLQCIAVFCSVLQCVADCCRCVYCRGEGGVHL